MTNNRFTIWHVGVTAEALTAYLFAQYGYDVSVQYGTNQPEYDLIVASGERLFNVSVKGSQDGGWCLCQGQHHSVCTAGILEAPVPSRLAQQRRFRHHGVSQPSVSSFCLTRPNKALQRTVTGRWPLTLYPAPEPLQKPATLTIKRIIEGASVFFLVTAARGDLLRCPLVGPYNFALIYPIVRLTSLLPVTHRGAESRSAVCLLKSPLGRSQRCSDFSAAPACTKVRCSTEFR